MRSRFLTLLASSALTSAVLTACSAQISDLDRRLLMGPWTSGGPSFDFDIRESTILYEFDMQEHPYALEGDVLVIDFRAASLGVQRKQIIELTRDVLVLQDVRAGSRTRFRRMP